MRIRDLIRGSLMLAAAAAVLVMERRHRARPYVEPRSTHTARNLAVAGIAAVTVQLLEAPVVMPLARTVARRRWGLSYAIGGPAWLRGVLAVLLLDYTLYLWHIVAHRVPWLWRFHLVHHVDLDLDATTGLRFHAGELAASIPWRAAQVIVLGVSPTTLTVWQSLTLVSVLFHHSNTRLSDRMERALSWIVTTPRMHAIHHSVNPAQLQSNFSSGLAVWDRLHRTARFDAAAGDVAVGVRGFLDPGEVSLPRVLGLPFEVTVSAADATPTPSVARL
jgi:sterol desaturase/sphingolipid hydroxylase (fatty acid hydroxylase superfamily)